MPRPCTVCQHLELHDINAALIQGTPLRTLAACYALTRSSLSRHRQAQPLTLGYLPPDELTAYANAHPNVQVIRVIYEDTPLPEWG